MEGRRVPVLAIAILVAAVLAPEPAGARHTSVSPALERRDPLTGLSRADPLAARRAGDRSQDHGAQPAASVVPRAVLSRAAPGRSPAAIIPQEHAQAHPQARPGRAGGAPVAWESFYASPRNSWELLEGMVASPDGTRIFTAGWSTGASSGFDAVVVAYDAATGERAWTDRFDAAADTDLANAIAVSPDGSRVYVTGYTFRPASGFDVLTMAYDAASGERLWTAVHAGAAGGDDGAYALALAPDGSRLFVTGTTSTPRGLAWSFLTIAYDTATGKERWAVPVRNGRVDVALAAGVSPDGSRVVVAGFSDVTFPVRDMLTVAHDAANGLPLWEARYDGPAHGADGVIDLAPAPSGAAVYVTGASEGASNDWATVAYDAGTGVERWVARFGGSGYDVPGGLAVSPGGSRVFVAGRRDATIFSADYATLAYDAATGAEVWTAAYDAGGSDAAQSLGIAPDGSALFVTGRSNAFDGRDADVATVAYDPATGAERWVRRAGGSFSDEGRALAVTGNRVVAGAESWGGDSLLDHLLQSFGLDGSPGWNARYDGPGSYGFDAASLTGLSPGGETLYVAGVSHEDWGRIRVLAYETASGRIRWDAASRGPAAGDPFYIDGDHPVSLALSPDGSRLYVCGLSTVVDESRGYSLITYDWLVVAFDTSGGGQLWSARFDGPRHSGDIARSVAVSPDGETVYVAGDSFTGFDADWFDVIVIAYDADTGVERYVTRFNAGDERTPVLALSPDGSRLAFAARGWNGVRGAGYDLVVGSLDAANGSLDWSRRYGSGGGFFETSLAGIAFSGSSHVVVGGTLGPEGDPDVVAVSFRATDGAPAWESVVDRGYDEVFAMAGAAGSIVLAGRLIRDDPTNLSAFFGGNDMLTVSVDAATGAQNWVASFDSGTPPNSPIEAHDIAFGVAASPDGRYVVVAGTSTTSDLRFDEQVLAYDAATGALEWSRRTTRGGEDVAYAAVAGADRAFVAGASLTVATWFDYHTTAFDLS